MIIDRPVITSLDVELAAPSPGLALSAGRLGTGRLNNTPTTWTAYLGAAVDVSIRRGGQRRGAATTIDVGTLTMTLLNTGDPRTDAAVRPNTSIRVRSKATGAALFTGRILDVDMIHRSNKSTGKFDRFVTLTAVDSVTSHANTKRYGAIASDGFETWEERITRLARSSRVPVQTPATPAPRVLYSIPENASADATIAGWTLLGGTTPRRAFSTYPVYATRAVIGSTSRQLVTRDTYYYEGTYNAATAANSWLDPAEGALGLVRTVTGLTPGKAYRLRAIAGIKVDDFFGTSTEGARANVYRLTAVGIGSGASLRLPRGLGIGYEMPVFDFVANSTTAVVGIELAARVNGTVGAQSFSESIGLGSFSIEEFPSDGSQLLSSVAFEASLADHFDTACASVNGGRWYVDAQGITQFSAGTGQSAIVATFGDVRSTGTLELLDAQTSFDTRNLVNDLTLKNMTTGRNDDGDVISVETEVGTTDPTSYATWGTRSDSLKVSVYDRELFVGGIDRRAREVLAELASPVLTVSSITWNVAEDPKTAGLIDVYSRVQVNFQGTSQPSRVTSIQHDISPTRWLMSLDLVRN
jgi:hypothetical protein